VTFLYLPALVVLGSHSRSCFVFVPCTTCRLPCLYVQLRNACV
jgi:hypothetical protein